MDKVSMGTDGSDESRITEQAGVTMSTFLNVLVSIYLKHLFKCLAYCCKASLRSQNMFVI